MEDLSNKTCLIYTRCSTEEQGKKTSHEYQKRECSSFAERHHMNILGYYSDTITGTSFDNRINLNMAYDFCKHNQVDYVIVYKMDRFGRDTKGAINTITLFKDLGTEVNFTDEWVNYADPTWPLLRNIKMGLAETESLKTADRTKDGIYQRKLQGHWAHAAVPVGYIRKVSEERKANGNLTSEVVPDKEKAPIVAKVFESYAAFHMNKADLFHLYGEDLGIGRSAFYRMFSKPFYKGWYHMDKYKQYPSRMIRGNHDAIVSEPVWDAVQERSENESSNAKGKTWYHNDIPEDHEYYLKGVLYCPRSGLKMTAGRNKSQTGRYYHYYSTPSGRNRVNIPVKLAHNIVLSAVSELEMRDEIYIKVTERIKKISREKVRSINSKLETFRKEQVNIVRNKERAMQDYFNGVLSGSLYQELASKLDTEAMRIGIKIGKLSSLKENFETSVLTAIHKARNLQSIYSTVNNRYKYSILSAIFPEGLTIDKEERTLRTPCVNKYLKEMLCESISYKKIKEDGSLSFAPVASRVDESALFELHFNLFINAMKLVS